MKKEMILESLIKTYLNELTPISSTELKRKCELTFSASTIRNYFQKLDDEGLIVKVHISSGRVPSEEAIKSYWYENLRYKDIKVDKTKLSKISSTFDVFMSIKKSEELSLNSVLKVGKRFIVLDFETDEIVLKYTDEMFQFFKEFINYSLDDIKKLLKVLKFDDVLSDKFSNKVETFNNNFLYKNYKNFYIDEFLTDKVFTIFENGLSFNKNYLAYKTDIFIGGQKNEFILIGDIYNDYIDIFKSIKEEE